MSRVFTTEVLFKGKRYRCIVAVPNEKEGALIHVRVFDPELIEILGCDTVEFEGLTGYKKMSRLAHPLSLSLLESISQAILQHLLK
jgi:hypothetical protein